MKHRLVTAGIVGGCAAVATLIWLLSDVSFLAAFVTTLGVAVLVTAIGVLRTNPPARPRGGVRQPLSAARARKRRRDQDPSK